MWGLDKTCRDVSSLVGVVVYGETRFAHCLGGELEMLALLLMLARGLPRDHAVVSVKGVMKLGATSASSDLATGLVTSVLLTKKKYIR